jgi:hypothetical protein
LVGLVVDGAALHGFIARIEALGLELVELRRLPPHPADGGPTSRCPEWGCGDEDGRRRAAAAVASRRFLGRSHGLSLATAVDAWPPSGVRPAHILCGTIRSLA